MYHKTLKNKEKIFAIAPMMDWTDRHCRYFHRLLSREALLYSEMVVADAVLHGDRDYLLGFSVPDENVALQLGGCDPEKLATAAKIGEQYGYKEINLNVGCPSDRVKSGTFGACLMRQPQLVARCISRMKEEVSVRVTVKCRIGVDDQNIEMALNDLAQAVWRAGCDHLWVHARKAWLEGLSPKENREIPPLDYDRVHRLKRENSNRFIGINGGIESIVQVHNQMSLVDGVMVGRAAYNKPELLRHIDTQVFGTKNPPISHAKICNLMSDYAENHLSNGGRLNQVTRHMIGLFHAQPGSRRFRQILSMQATKPNAGPQVIYDAFDQVLPEHVE